MLQRIGAIICTVFIMGALTSCGSSSESIADSSEPHELPEGFVLSPGEEFHPLAVATDDGTLYVVTWGSSSCPPVPTGLARTDSLVTVTFDPSPHEVCTADIAPTTHTFSEAKVGGTVPAEAKLIFTDTGEELIVEVQPG